jgi:3-oxoacyl-[acyl-carrier protein] reductase
MWWKCLGECGPRCRPPQGFPDPTFLGPVDMDSSKSKQSSEVALTGLAGRVALVTGGSRGIGAAIVRRLAQAGARVAVNYRARRDAAEALVAEIHSAGGEALAVGGDVADDGAVVRMVGEVEAALGPVELLVNSAGVFDYLTFDQVTPAIWRRTLDVNLTGTYLMSWAVKDRMLSAGFGRIVNLSSISALQPRPLSIAYAASKAGLAGLTKGCAAAWAARGIRVNAIAPGLIETEILEGVSEPQKQALIAATPMQRIGQPSEIADLTVYLLSDQASFVTGQTIVACGGRCMVP